MAARLRLRTEGREEVAERSPESADLINKVEDNRDALLVDAQILSQILNQLRSRKINFRKLPSIAVQPWGQPSRLDPHLQQFGAEACSQKEFTAVQDHASMF